jgi:hypothetical protein
MEIYWSKLGRNAGLGGRRQSQCCGWEGDSAMESASEKGHDGLLMLLLEAIEQFKCGGSFY